MKKHIDKWGATAAAILSMVALAATLLTGAGPVRADWAWASHEDVAAVKVEIESAATVREAKIERWLERIEAKIDRAIERQERAP